MRPFLVARGDNGDYRAEAWRSLLLAAEEKLDAPPEWPNYDAWVAMQPQVPAAIGEVREQHDPLCTRRQCNLRKERELAIGRIAEDDLAGRLKLWRPAFDVAGEQRALGVLLPRRRIERKSELRV